MKSLMNNIWLKRVLAFIGHCLLILATIWFFIEASDPYVAGNLLLADMTLVFSVLIFYIDKLVMFLYKRSKRYFVCIN